LFAGAASAEQARVLAATLGRWAALVAWLVPSTDPGHASFEPLRYWRGPVWAVVNWMIAEGFADAGNTTMATRIRDHTRRLINTGGFSEYFDPTDGKGVGGADFSWTAAIWLLLEDAGATA
jgi:alpha,alpha-trehalase